MLFKRPVLPFVWKTRSFSSKQTPLFTIFPPKSGGSFRAIPLVLLSPYGDWVWHRSKFVDFFTERGFEVMVASTSRENAEQQENDLVQAIRSFPFPPVAVAHSFSSLVVSKYLESNPVSAVVHMCPYTPTTPLHIVSQYARNDPDTFLSKISANTIASNKNEDVALSLFPFVATNRGFLQKYASDAISNESDFPDSDLFSSSHSFSLSAASDIIRSPPLIEPSSVRMCLVRGLHDRLVDSKDVAWTLQRHEIVSPYIIDDYVLQQRSPSEVGGRGPVEVDEDEDSLITMTQSGHFPMFGPHSHHCAEAILAWINRRF